MRKFMFMGAIFALIFCASSSAFAQAEPAAADGAESTIPLPPDGKQALVVMDERDKMETLAKYLKEKGGIESNIVDQKSIPEDWSKYSGVLGYVHGKLDDAVAEKIIAYTNAGGRFVCLHHMISSGKTEIANKNYFPFLKVHMDGIKQAKEPAEPGTHYAWREGIQKTIVNLAPGNYITSHKIEWPEKAEFKPMDRPEMEEKEYPAFTSKKTEAYMNVKQTEDPTKVLLLGYKFFDDRNKTLYQQATDGWMKPSEKGWIVYIQPGHFVEEFENPILAQMILNAIEWQPAQ